MMLMHLFCLTTLISLPEPYCGCLKIIFNHYRIVADFLA